MLRWIIAIINNNADIERCLNNFCSKINPFNVDENVKSTLIQLHLKLKNYFIIIKQKMKEEKNIEKNAYRPS